MRSSTKNEAEGKLHKVKGTIKNAVGKLVGDKSLEEEGREEIVEGKVQDKISQIEKVVER